MKYTILTLFFLSLSSWLFGQSRIEFDSTVCHLGKYQEGESLEFNLCFRNKGKTPVRIVNAYEVGGVGVCDYPKESTDLLEGKVALPGITQHQVVPGGDRRRWLLHLMIQQFT